MTTPDWKFQVEFLRQIQNLLTDGGFTATYKYALLHAIADLCVESTPAPDGTLTLSVDQLAGKFIDLYWGQAQDYPLKGIDLVLRQTTMKKRQAEVITALREVQPRYEARLPRLRNDLKEWARTVRKVSRTITKEPLWKLQTMGDRPVEFIYRNNRGADHIDLLPGVADCFRAFHGLIIELARAAWVRFVQRSNEDIRESLELYAFLFGNERAALEGYEAVIAKIEGRRCFYCLRSIREKAHVDHFIPWVRHQHDLGHNFVIAHGKCNNSKSDHLAAENHLERWVTRNRTLGADLSEGFKENGLAHEQGTSLRVARWAYEQVEANRGMVWVAGKDFRPLSAAWRGLI